MLLGAFQTNADDEGRLGIPPPFRSVLREGLTLTRGIDPCLVIYPAEEWQKLAGRVRSRLSITDRDARFFVRLIFSGALACVPDREGAIPLPGRLREYAGIEGEVTLVGLGTHIEVWNPRRWEEVSSRLVEEGAEIAHRLSRWEI